MKAFLRKVKLIDSFIAEVPMEQTQFVGRLGQQVDHGSLSPFSGLFDIFSASTNEYKGYVNQKGFKIKRRRRFFDMNINAAIASGSFQNKGNSLIISTEINGFHGIMIPFYVLITLFYLTAISVFLLLTFQGEVHGDMLVGASFILVHAGLMYGLPYFLMRRSMARMKRELEREFFYMTRAS